MLDYVKHKKYSNFIQNCFICFIGFYRNYSYNYNKVLYGEFNTCIQSYKKAIDRFPLVILFGALLSNFWKLLLLMLFNNN